MGTTIRRQPVNFDIPRAPDYKFLNITNFRGLDVSSNPFELANNTASDCLNVYVDETNTLTTRPRLEKKIATPLKGTHVGTYNLHDGYLLHYITDNGPEMWFLKDGQLNDNKVSGTIPTNKCKHFEQGDKVYLLDGERYMVIADNALTDVEGYVPTTAVVSLDGSEIPANPLNILSKKYKKSFVWDGTYHIPQITSSSNTQVENKAFKTLDFSDLMPAYSFIKYFSDNTVLLKKENYLYTTTLIPYENSYQMIPLNIQVADDDYVDAATVSKDIIVCGAGKLWLYKYLGYNTWGTPIEMSKNSGDSVLGTDRTYIKTHISPQGKYAWLIRAYDLIYVYTIAVIEDENVSIRSGGSEQYNGKILHIEFDDELLSNKLNVPMYQIYQSTTSADTKVLEFNDEDGKAYSVEYSSPDDFVFKVTQNKICYIYFTEDNRDKVYIFDLYNNKKQEYTFPHNTVSNFFEYDSTTNTFYWIDGNNHNLWIANALEPNLHYNTFMKIDHDVVFNNDIRTIATVSSNAFVVYVWNEDNPTIEITTELSSIDNEYSQWLEHQKTFMLSYLNTRFDNNYWFASGNRYYRSANNDPTYFPITEYNDLGDSNEKITGFNLANDTTLLAYKQNRLYLIQPFSSSLDTVEYSVTESKNTVGNTAINAPIVTTLTEIPLQINNDGIYGLSQLQNVSATERIADLMSEPINERWLNIDDELIKNTQTLNRLYWTYVIIPDNAHGRTMIYLLDNRSNSWYYWELPIVVADSFVKDNKAEFVDTQGAIYYLTTTDIENKAFDTQLVTDYYDDGKKLISWHWQSQVLPMGTMNYSKRLVNTTFILTDTDTQDGYGLQYNFKVFRKLASSTPEKEVSGDINLVRSTTKKTNISKFGFLQLKISNITEESQGTEAEKAFRNNKLRLVGLGLKYVLLEGLIR